MPDPFPLTLLTADPAAGHVLARRLATQLLPVTPTNRDMAQHLRSPVLPMVSVELATAIYFQAITVANRGWNESGPR